jgi:tetratricopeptide (TPR) repeat protein
VAIVVDAQARPRDESRAELSRRLAKLFNERKFKEALPLAEQLVDLTKRAKGEDDPGTAEALANLGAVYENMCDFATAEPLVKEALQIYQKVLGRENPVTINGMDNLAHVYMDTDDYAKAEPLYKEALEICLKVFGRESR